MNSILADEEDDDNGDDDDGGVEIEAQYILHLNSYN
jgi:hypothetical protein